MISPTFDRIWIDQHALSVWDGRIKHVKMDGIRMFRPKACSPAGDSPGTTDDSPDDI